MRRAFVRLMADPWAEWRTWYGEVALHRHRLLRQVLMSREIPENGRRCLTVAWTMRAGVGLRLRNQNVTVIHRTSHGAALGGQSRGTGAGGGGVAWVWIRVVAGTGGTHVPTGTKTALVFGDPLGRHVTAETKVIRVARNMVEIKEIRAVLDFYDLLGDRAQPLLGRRLRQHHGRLPLRDQRRRRRTKGVKGLPKNSTSRSSRGSLETMLTLVPRHAAT